jgi:calcineurin-like phosphoesterase family protein
MRVIPASGRALAGLLALTACEGLPGFSQRPAAAVAPPRVAAGPWLIDPKAGGMTVCWLTDTPSVGRVWYGTAAPDRLATEEGAPVTTHRVALASLPMQTQVRYHVEGSDQDFVFTSAPEAGAEGPVEVLVYGDNRTNSGDHALVARAAAAEHAALALHTGDMVVSATQEDLWRVWFQEEHDLLATTPLVPTVGNHEITDDGVAYSKYFQHRERPAYWSVDYGPLHIAVLDSFEMAAGATPHSGSISDAQKAWLEEDLRRVPADRHVWILVHQGPFSHPAHARPGHGGSDAVRAAVMAARKIHPVEVVFAGHEHFYERGEIDGLNYFVLGGGGAPLDDPDPSFPGVQAAQKALSYATVTVCGCHTTGKVKDIAGAVIDSFELATCATPCGAPAAPALTAATVPLALAPLTEAADGGSRRRSRRRRGADDAGTAETPDAGAAEPK